MIYIEKNYGYLGSHFCNSQKCQTKFKFYSNTLITQQAQLAKLLLLSTNMHLSVT